MERAFFPQGYNVGKGAPFVVFDAVFSVTLYAEAVFIGFEKDLEV